jgi:hypothetical protein
MRDSHYTVRLFTGFGFVFKVSRGPFRTLCSQLGNHIMESNKHGIGASREKGIESVKRWMIDELFPTSAPGPEHRPLP